MTKMWQYLHFHRKCLRLEACDRNDWETRRSTDQSSAKFIAVCVSALTFRNTQSLENDKTQSINRGILVYELSEGFPHTAQFQIDVKAFFASL